MCSNYEPVTRADRMPSFFGVVPDHEHPTGTVFPTGLAPFMRLAENGSGNRRADSGAFGLLPSFAKEVAFGRRTYNARTETVATLPSFRDAWQRSQRCIVLAESIFEPSYESGKAVRWRIFQQGTCRWGSPASTRSGAAPMTAWNSSAAMLTVNADGHPVMQRFHKPEDEKRMVVTLAPEEYDAWLTCPLSDAPKLFRQWMGRLESYAAPLPHRAARTASGNVVVPPKPAVDELGDLF